MNNIKKYFVSIPVETMAVLPKCHMPVTVEATNFRVTSFNLLYNLILSADWHAPGFWKSGVINLSAIVEQFETRIFDELGLNVKIGYTPTHDKVDEPLEVYFETDKDMLAFQLVMQ